MPPYIVTFRPYIYRKIVAVLLSPKLTSPEAERRVVNSAQHGRALRNVLGPGKR